MMIRILPLLAVLLAAAQPAAAQLATRPGAWENGTLGGAASTRDGDAYHDAWTFPGEAGQSYYIAVRSDEFAPVLRVGSTAADPCPDCVYNEPDRRDSSAYAIFTVRRSGDYVIRVSARGKGGTGRYRLSMNHGTMRWPVDTAAATALRFGEPAAGELTPGDGDWRGSYADVYTFSGLAGDTVAVTMRAEGFGPFVIVEFANSGGYVGAEDYEFDEALVVELPYDGVYAITATSQRERATGRYTVAVERRP
jgi:hypothetical protein